MEQQQYLEKVVKLLSTAIASIDQELDISEKEINEMHDYYWENYSEFDEFGYENYTNQQMLLREVNSKADKIKQRHTYEMMKNSPYFASIDFQYEDEDEVERYYIGISNFSERNGAIPLVFDWRAPISSLFYDYDSGAASFLAPGGQIRGEIKNKAQYKIKNGKLIYFFENDVKIDDEILQAELSQSADAKLKSIVTTIQKEQNAIIRNEKDRVLVVQGSAGSGKTSVALHRIAYLLYHHRKDMKASDVLILSPNSIFSDYISHILPELNEENILEMTFDAYAQKELKGIGETEAYYNFLEFTLLSKNEKALKRKEAFQRKGSQAYVEALWGFVLDLEVNLIRIRDISFNKVVRGGEDKMGREKRTHLSFNVTAEEISRYYYEKFPDYPLLLRMEMVADYFLDSFETLYGKNYDEVETIIIKEKFENLYETKDILTLYNRFLISNGERPINTEARKIPYEDVYPILYLKYLLEGAPKGKVIKHLIIDEMQDYSYLQYCIIQKVFHCPMTILGDWAQTLTEEKSDVLSYLPKILGKDMKKVELKKSFRSTFEISSFASNLIGLTGIEYVKRHGKQPEIQECLAKEEVTIKIASNLKDQEKIHPEFETYGILCRTAKDAEELYQSFMLDWNQSNGEELNHMPVQLLTKDTDRFYKGVVISPYYLAKGLEFDAVHVLVPALYKDEKQMLYICATRALHELNVYVN
ncbi:MAG: HelD family protein [Lachnospiraceae bacterium]